LASSPPKLKYRARIKDLLHWFIILRSVYLPLSSARTEALKAQDSALILIDHQIISMSMIKTQALEIAHRPGEGG
jgi:hypothetical protein